MGSPKVLVRLFDAATISPRLMIPAKDTATKILPSAGVGFGKKADRSREPAAARAAKPFRFRSSIFGLLFHPYRIQSVRPGGAASLCQQRRSHHDVLRPRFEYPQDGAERADRWRGRARRAIRHGASRLFRGNAGQRRIGARSAECWPPPEGTRAAPRRSWGSSARRCIGSWSG
jgi:hypothetical protein